MLRVRTIIVAALLLPALAALASPADARKVKLQSIVEIDGYLETGAFTGTVGSFDSKRCTRRRLVTVWRRNPGAMDGPFGTAKTNRSGHWSLSVVAAPGSYYATVKSRRLHRSKKGDRRLCKLDRSEAFLVP